MKIETEEFGIITIKDVGYVMTSQHCSKEMFKVKLEMI